VVVVRRARRVRAALSTPRAWRLRRLTGYTLRMVALAWMAPWVIPAVLPALPLVWLAVVLEGRLAAYIDTPDELWTDGGDACRGCDRR
jgi:hypothetical protein